MTKIFFDFEFTGLHRNTTPISFGAITETNKKFYYIFRDYDTLQINDWLQDNVINNLYKGFTPNDKTLRFIVSNKESFKKLFLQWLQKESSICEFYGDVIPYDWMLFIDLMADYDEGYPKLPDCIYYIPFDIATMFKIRGIDPDISRLEFSEIKEFQHNALFDAIIIKECYRRLFNGSLHNPDDITNSVGC